MSALPKDARACGGADPNRVGGILTFAERKRARGMLADKQGINSIAEELECDAAQIQALADAKPKAVRLSPCAPARLWPAYTRCERSPCRPARSSCAGERTASWCAVLTALEQP